MSDVSCRLDTAHRDPEEYMCRFHALVVDLCSRFYQANHGVLVAETLSIEVDDGHSPNLLCPRGHGLDLVHLVHAGVCYQYSDPVAFPVPFDAALLLLPSRRRSDELISNGTSIGINPRNYLLLYQFQLLSFKQFFGNPLEVALRAEA